MSETTVRWTDNLGQQLTARQFSETSQARAEFATLRNAARRAPGEDAKALPLVFSAVPDPDTGRDALSDREIAAFHALTLHAEHCQGGYAAHKAGATLGHAVYVLGARRASLSSINRRFQALISSDQVDELVMHLRPLVRMMRQEKLPLDYTRLAADIAGWPYHDSRTRTRIRWSRDWGSASNQTDTDHNEVN